MTFGEAGDREGNARQGREVRRRADHLLDVEGDDRLHRRASRTAPSAARRTAPAGPGVRDQQRIRPAHRRAAAVALARTGELARARANHTRPIASEDHRGGAIERNAVAAGDVGQDAADDRPDQRADQLPGAEPAQRIAEPVLGHLARHQRDRGARRTRRRRPSARGSAKNCQTLPERPISAVNKRDRASSSASASACGRAGRRRCPTSGEAKAATNEVTPFRMPAQMSIAASVLDAELRQEQRHDRATTPKTPSS